MPVAISSVRAWWILDGIGHALFSFCHCGECPDRFQAVCGLRGLDGERTDIRPDVVCSACKRRLADPSIFIYREG